MAVKSVTAIQTLRQWARENLYCSVICIAVLTMSMQALAEAPYAVAWTRQIPGEGWCTAIDSAGNAYVTGSGAAPSGNCFLKKYDSSGNSSGTAYFGGVGYEAYSVATDPSGGAYITGSGGSGGFLAKFSDSGALLWSKLFTNTVGYFSSVAVAPRTGDVCIAGNVQVGNSLDINVIKYDRSGTQIWSRQFGTTGNDFGRAISVDVNSNIYISGDTAGNLSGTYGGGKDAFLLKCDNSGNVLWSRQYGASGDQASRSVAVDKYGNTYIAGWSLSATNGFLAKYDSSGTLLWTRQDDKGYFSVAVDVYGNPYIYGSAPGTTSLVKYDTSGGLLWCETLGSPLSGMGLGSVALDATGNVYLNDASTVYKLQVPAGNSALTAAPATGGTFNFPQGYLDRFKTITSAVTLSNTGTGGTTLQLTGAAITGIDAAKFAFSGSTGITVAAAGTAYDVQFLGAHYPGTYTATLTLTTDAATGPTSATYNLSAVVARLVGDATLDNVVNFSDYLALEQNFNTTCTSDTGADFTKDGQVNFSDYLALEQNFNTSAPAVPEPMTLSLLGLGALALIRRRK